MATTSKKAPKILSIRFAITGQAARVVKVKEGTTIQQFSDANTLEGLRLKVNGMTPSADYKLANGDTLVAVTNVKAG